MAAKVLNPSIKSPMSDHQTDDNANSGDLKRSIGPSLLSVYGAGTILGAGIFVLIGKVAGTAGYYTPLAFFIAAVVGAINGMVYAELATRSPGAGGPSDYIHKAFSTRWFSNLIGWMIVATGVVSGATITTGFSGYLVEFVSMPEWIARTGLLVVLGSVAALGAKESAWFMAITTSLGIIALFLVLYAGFFSDHAQSFSDYTAELPGLFEASVLTSLASASFLAVYAYIGFEDMVHMAEEVKKPARSMPIGIAVALAAAAILYFFVSVAALNILSPEDLDQSKAPLVAVAVKAGIPQWLMVFLSLAIILNGALAQIIMATRVMYSMGDRQGVPNFFAHISKLTNTPLLSTIIATGVCLALALFIPLKTLASITSTIMLLIFIASNAALIVLERKEPEAPFDTARWVPWVAMVLCAGLVAGNFLISGGGH